jgi:uncharacterized protein YrrD
MKNSLQVIGLPLLGINEGSEYGYASNFIINAPSKQVSYIIIQGNKGYFDLYALPMKSIVGIGNEYIITSSIKNAEQFSMSFDARQMSDAGFFILGTKVVSYQGNALGEVREFEFDENTGEVTAITLTDGTKFSKSQIAAFSKGLVFVNTSEDFVNSSMLDNTSFETVGQAVRADAAGTAASGLEAEQHAYLIGKVVLDDIIDIDGSVVVSKGTVVDDGVLNLCVKKDLTVELTLNV